MENAEEKGLIEKGKETSEEALSDVLGWALDKSAMEHGPIDSAQEIAEDFIGKHNTIYEDAEELINWQIAKSGGIGFLTGLLGPISAIAGIPSSLAAVTFVQLRMIAAIAHMGGYNINDDRVKALCLACLCGNAANKIVKEAGVEAGQRLLVAVAMKFPGKAVDKVCRAVAAKLLVGAGVKTGTQLSKFIPVFGGLVNGAVDAAFTKAVGVAAAKVFIGENDSKVAKRSKAISI